MKAMRLPRVAPIDSSPLEMVELPMPEPGPGEVRVKVHCCAVCRTDLHVVEGDLPQEKMPIIPGHQVVGMVDALGPQCERLSLGTRVGLAWLRWTCGRCRFCGSGRENLCPDARFTGYHADGGYAQYTVAPEAFAYEIPAVFGDVEAAPLLCAGIIGYRALKRAEVPPGGKLALYGFGSSAHVLIQIARHRGCEVYVATRDQEHRDLARSMGAVWVGARPEELPVKVDSAILFAPVGALVPPALEKLDRGGTLALAGIYMTPIPEMDYQRCVFFERDIRSVTSNTRADGRELLAEAAEIPIRPRTTLYPLSEANRALQDLKADRINGTGVLMCEG
ncbi:MAG: zinc-dependent alcohol dehydrogenase family protein [Thermoguttaceae bacterium]|jgi:propanol-preferring alcohol dehydrogenase